jgi:hypothetical protein
MRLQATQVQKIFCSIIFLCIFSKADAQVSLSLIITDNIITNAFTFEPPKPAAPKSTFLVGADKGTQVFFYLGASGTSEITGSGYRVRLIAYKTDNDKDEWVNEVTYLLKKNDKYGIVAMNFFTPGPYKIVISENADKSNILATGNFSLEKN